MKYLDFTITLDCASISDSTLLESEIFGHEKDSWKGAFGRKIGLIEVAANLNFILLNSYILPISIRNRIKAPNFKRLGGNEFRQNKANVIFK